MVVKCLRILSIRYNNLIFRAANQLECTHSEYENFEIFKDISLSGAPSCSSISVGAGQLHLALQGQGDKGTGEVLYGIAV